MYLNVFCVIFIAHVHKKNILRHIGINSSKLQGNVFILKNNISYFVIKLLYKAAFTVSYILVVYLLVYWFIHLIFKQLSLCINYILNNTFSVAPWRFIFHLYFSDQVKFDSKSINQEFLLLLNSLNYF